MEMRTVSISVQVSAPIEIDDATIADLVAKVLAIGQADAQATAAELNEEDAYEKAVLATQLEFGHPVVAT